MLLYYMALSPVGSYGFFPKGKFCYREVLYEGKMCVLLLQCFSVKVQSDSNFVWISLSVLNIDII